MVTLFEVPEDLTNEQVQELFEAWADFTDVAIKAGHTPRPDCETCIETFEQHVTKVRHIAEG